MKYQTRLFQLVQDAIYIVYEAKKTDSKLLSNTCHEWIKKLEQHISATDIENNEIIKGWASKREVA